MKQFPDLDPKKLYILFAEPGGVTGAREHFDSLVASLATK